MKNFKNFIQESQLNEAKNIIDKNKLQASYKDTLNRLENFFNKSINNISSIAKNIGQVFSSFECSFIVSDITTHQSFNVEKLNKIVISNFPPKMRCTISTEEYIKKFTDNNANVYAILKRNVIKLSDAYYDITDIRKSDKIISFIVESTKTALQ